MLVGSSCTSHDRATGPSTNPQPGGAIRILFVSDSIREPVTGVGRVALTWMRELVALGAEVIPLDSAENPTARAICGTCQVLPCSGSFMRMGRWHLNLLRRIAAVDIPHDVLFDPTGYPNARGHHPRQAVLVHDLSMFRSHLYRHGKRTWFRLFYPRALRKAQLKVCVSEYTRGELIAQMRLDPNSCVVVPNGIDPEFATAQATPHPDAPTAPYFLVVGTIEPRKNTERLLRAFAATDTKAPLVFAGRFGAGSQTLRAWFDRLGERVVHLDRVDDAQLRHLYRHALALLFPSLEEGFGLPILEAMQSDLPVLTSNVTAMPEVAGDAALLVDPTDEAALRAGIEQLASDAALRSALIHRGRDRLPQFAVRRNAAELLRHLAALGTAPGDGNPGIP